METNRIKDLVGRNKEIAKMFDDLPPFTITITDGYDSCWLSSAMLTYLAGGDHELGEKSLKTMLIAAKSVGVEKGVAMFFDEGLRRGHKFPKCIKPMFIHMIGHALKKYEENK